MVRRAVRDPRASSHRSLASCRRRRRSEHGSRHEAGRTGNRRAQADAGFDHEDPRAGIGPPKSAEIAEERAAVASTASSRAAGAVDDGEPGGRAERDQRRLGPEHKAERKRAERGERDAPGP